MTLVPCDPTRGDTMAAPPDHDPLFRPLRAEMLPEAIVSPRVFSLWQRGTSLGVWLLLPGVVLGVVALLPRSLKVSWLELAVAGFTGVAGTLGYAAWAMSNDWNGLVRRPRTPWRVSFDGQTLHVRASGWSTDIPLARIRSACVVAEGSWETLKGVEDRCLVLRVEGALQISIPGSSEGFDGVRGALDGALGVGFKELGVE